MNKKAPVPASTGPELETPTEALTTERVKEMSNTILSQPSDIDQKAMGEWIAKVREIHAEATKPMHDGDPRYEELIDASPAHYDPAEWTPEQNARFYFFDCVTLPVWPGLAPEWAERTEPRTGSYPDISIGHFGKRHEHGDRFAQIEQWMTIYVEDQEEFDGLREVGFHQTFLPVISTDRDDYSLGVAESMSLTMTRALRQFYNAGGEN